MRLLPVGFVLAVSALGACSLFTSIDGFTGGSSPDASASSDGTPGDASAPKDASTTSDAGPFRWCATQDAAFCDDFDLGTSVPGAWTTIELSQGELGIFPDDAAPSGPNVYKVKTVPGPNGDGWMNLVKDFDVIPREVRIAYDLRIDSTTLPLPFTILPSIALGVGGSEMSVAAGLIDNQSFLNEFIEYADGGSDGTGDKPRSAGIPLGQWSRVEVRVVFGKPGSLALSFGGVIVQARDARTEPPPIVNGKLRIYLGIYRDGTTPVAFSFDNVIVDYK